MNDDKGRIGRNEELLMRAFDDELEPDERFEFERLLSDNPELRGEWERLSKLQEVTANMNEKAVRARKVERTTRSRRRPSRSARIPPAAGTNNPLSGTSALSTPIWTPPKPM